MGTNAKTKELFALAFSQPVVNACLGFACLGFGCIDLGETLSLVQAFVLARANNTSALGWHVATAASDGQADGFVAGIVGTYSAIN